MKMNNENMLIVFDLSKGAGKAKGEKNEVKLFLIYLHLINKMKYKN